MAGATANGVRRTTSGATASGPYRTNGPPTPPRSVNGASSAEDDGLASQVAQVARLTEQVRCYAGILHSIAEACQTGHALIHGEQL